MSRKETSEGVRKTWDKYKYVGLVILIGVVLLVWPRGEKAEVSAQDLSAVTQSQEVTQMREEMEGILSHISGVGQVQVMLTVDSDGERQLAQDTDLAYSGPTAAPDDYSRRSETVLVDGGDGDTVMVVTRRYPVYRGALVVCTGGDRADIKLKITQAVSALTGLSADRITVEKWQ